MDVLKFILIFTFFYLSYQDIKERLIDWFLIPIICLIGGILHYSSVLGIIFWMSALLNLLLISVIILGIDLYFLFKRKYLGKNTYLKDVIGLGDILLFIALSTTFSSVSFLVLFVASLIFSLLIHLFFKDRKHYKTIPLAGHMSLFFAVSYLGFWCGFTNILYSF